MILYQLTTDLHGQQYVSVRSERDLREAMMRYIRNRREAGAKISHIIFSYARCEPKPIPTGEKRNG